jgi:hypothetical protein
MGGGAISIGFSVITANEAPALLDDAECRFVRC